MERLIQFVSCRITIITNWLPIYKITLVIYLAIPLIIITYYRNRFPNVKPIIFATTLLIIWLIQMAIWNKGHSIYYGLWSANKYMAIDNNTYPHMMALGAPLNSHIHGIDTKPPHRDWSFDMVENVNTLIWVKWVFQWNI